MFTCQRMTQGRCIIHKFSTLDSIGIIATPLLDYIERLPSESTWAFIHTGFPWTALVNHTVVTPSRTFLLLLTVSFCHFVYVDDHRLARWKILYSECSSATAKSAPLTLHPASSPFQRRCKFCHFSLYARTRCSLYGPTPWYEVLIFINLGS